MPVELPILDAAHLHRQTLGDATLRREVLALFAAQLKEMPSRLSTADPKERIALLHGLKGSARAVGAMALAREAEHLESSAAVGGDGELQRLTASTLRALEADPPAC